MTDTLNGFLTSIADNDELKGNDLLILITGDMVNAGNYGKSTPTVIKFFKKLRDTLRKNNVNVVDIEIAPGNHDKVIDNSTRLYSIAQQSRDSFPENKSQAQSLRLSHLPTDDEILKLQEKAFSNYLELCNKIFEMFGLKNSKDEIKTYSNTFGVNKIIIGNTNIAVIRMNTAICSYGCPADSEKYHLVLGSTQKDALCREYRTIRDESNIENTSFITFCIAHHPTRYLAPKEATQINQILIAKESLNVDFFFSGHIHDGSINNLSNHNRSMLSMETGLGWPDSETTENAHKDHRYAIHCFDEEKNVFYSIMYKTNQNNEFSFDNDYLLTKQEKETGKIYSPLKTRNYAFVPLNDYNNSDIRYLFVDGDILKNLNFLFNTTNEFVTITSKMVSEYVYSITDLLLDSKHKEDTKKMLVDIFQKNIVQIKEPAKYRLKDELSESFKHLINELQSKNSFFLKLCFVSFLQQLCDYFIQFFNQYFEEYAECRAVFRTYLIENQKEEYIPICTSPAIISPRASAKQNTSGFPRIFEFDKSIIAYAYEKKSSIIYSLNAEKNNFILENWDDFLVSMPEIDEYKVNKRKKVPSIVFVLSVRIKEDYYNDTINRSIYLKNISNKLLLIKYVGIDKIISSLLQDFLETFPLDLQTFVKSFKNYKNEIKKYLGEI